MGLIPNLSEKYYSINMFMQLVKRLEHILSFFEISSKQALITDILRISKHYVEL